METEIKELEMKAKDVIIKIVKQGLPVVEFEKFLDTMTERPLPVSLIEIETAFVNAGADRVTIIEMIEDWQIK